MRFTSLAGLPASLGWVLFVSTLGCSGHAPPAGVEPAGVESPSAQNGAPSSSPNPPAPICGDGIVNQPSEQCDDGNGSDDDDCTNACTRPRCGDGIVQNGEQCDDGNLDGDDSCSDACTLNGDTESGSGAMGEASGAGDALSECGACARAACTAQRAVVDTATMQTNPVLKCLLGEEWQNGKWGNRVPETSCSNADLVTCYCGGIPAEACSSMAPSSLTGQCTQVILTATGCADSSCVASSFLSPGNANGEVALYVECMQDLCHDDCFTADP